MKNVWKFLLQGSGFGEAKNVMAWFAGGRVRTKGMEPGWEQFSLLIPRWLAVKGWQLEPRFWNFLLQESGSGEAKNVMTWFAGGRVRTKGMEPGWEQFSLLISRWLAVKGWLLEPRFWKFLLQGSGFGEAKNVMAWFAGGRVAMKGMEPGRKQFSLLIPRWLADEGPAEVVITADGKPSNAVYVNIK